MKTLRYGVSLILVMLVALVAVYAAPSERADAATSRPSAPLVSARSAGLATDRGLVRLGSAGTPSRGAAVSLAQMLASRSANARPANPVPQSAQNVMDIAYSMCKDTNWVGDIPVVGTALASICGALITAVVSILKIMSDAITSITMKLIQPLLSWLLKESIGVATGYSKECSDPAKAKAMRACKGQASQARVLLVAKGNTAKTITVLSLLMALPLLLAAVISALIKQSLSELGKTLLRLPFVWILAVVSIVIVSAAVGLRDGMVTFIINQSNMMANIDKFTNADAFWTVTTTGQGLGQLVAAIAGLFGAFFLFIIFLIGDIVVLCSVLFVPLATVGLIWGGTAKWFKRIGELSFSFIVGKVVVVAILAMAFELLAV